MNQEPEARNQEPVAANRQLPRPRISVCIGAYNRERYIRECIDSVLSQTRPADEIVVVDDASTDQTLAILESYGDAIRLIRRDQNSGMCQITRNQATKAATGDLIAYLDSDDAWYPQKLEKQEDFMVAHPEVDLCHTYAEVMDAESRALYIRHEGIIPSTGDCFRAMMEQCVITISSVMVRRAIFDKVGFFNEDPFWRIGEDSEFFFRVTKDYPVGFIPDVLTRYRKSDAGITSGSWNYTPRVLPIHEWMLRNPSRWQGRVSRRDVLDIIRNDCRENAIYWREKGVRHYAVHHAAKWIRYRPFETGAWMEMLKALLTSPNTQATT